MVKTRNMSSRSHQFINPKDPKGSTEKVISTDWNKCVICQDVSSEALQCPVESKWSDVAAGKSYSIFASNILRFHELGDMPMGMDISRLDNGEGIETTLRSHRAKWHKSCHLKCSSTKLQRAEKRQALVTESDPGPSSSKKFTRKSVQPESANPNVCFFCETELSSAEPFREAATIGLDARVRMCAIDLQDERLLAKLSSGDLIAQEAKYHVRCLISLYRKAATVRDFSNSNTADSDNRSHGIALAELLSYIDETRMDADMAPVFKLVDLVRLYADRLEQLGVKQEERIHSTQLKNRILAQFPDLTAHKEGRDILLAFDKDIGLALRKACQTDDFDNDAICLAKAANIIRRDIHQKQSIFTGRFDNDCQIQSVPQSLLALILYGPNIKSQLDDVATQESLSLAQLLFFNSVKRRRSDSVNIHHSKFKEPPLPVYTGLTVHARTRKRELVETLFDLGLSISYDRVLEISTEMGNTVCEQYQRDQVVCPPNLRSGLFTTAAIDNIDHNPSSTTATDSFHGTGISLFQHPSVEQPGTSRMIRSTADIEATGRKCLKQLPDSYLLVRPISLSIKDVIVPKVDSSMKSNDNIIHGELQKEIGWLDHVEQNCEEDIDCDSNISWSAYHANLQSTCEETVPAVTSLLPLFPDDSKSVSMIRHSMDVIKQAVEKLNPGQIPVVTLDQPLYALSKQIQWHFPDHYGEDRFVVVLGGLHIEMAALNVIGDWLEDSGWVEALVDAKVASPGTADSFLKVSHVTRTRHAHQVTACALHILLKKTYEHYLETGNKSHELKSFDEWCTSCIKSTPQFLFWHTALQLEILVLTYVRSLRSENFPLYIESLTALVKWFFCLDHSNYARWLPVHIRDMTNLKSLHPGIDSEFRDGKFTVHRSKRPFSSIAIDQAHEQNNANVKSEGGAIGLTQNPDALRRWMVAGPEIVRITSEFEASVESCRKKMTTNDKHLEQTKSSQMAFAKHVKSLVETMEEMGNPFMEESQDLLKLDTKDIMGQVVIDSIRQAEDIGHNQYQTFVKDRFTERSVPLTDPIKKNKLSLFRHPPTREKSKASLQVSSLRSDCSLFSRLYIACQSRDGNLSDFFRHENQACPPSISHLGQLRTGTKSDLISRLENNCTDVQSVPPNVDAIILDGAVIVNILKPIAVRTFDDYAQKVFTPYIHNQLQHATRLDIVWDRYIENSLKHQTRNKRGTGTRRRVEASTNLPGNWQDFLRIDSNKVELFSFLARHISEQVLPGKQIITTDGTDVLCSHERDTSQLAPCDHEEADTRMILHLSDAVSEGHKRIMLRTVDTDVVALAVSVVDKVGIEELWIALGTGKHLRYLPAHKMAAILGPDKSRALPFFHAYTGCDTVSSFYMRGKKTAWETWNTYAAVTPAFLALSSGPPEVGEEEFHLIERFTILLYDRTSELQNIDAARQELFTKKGRSMDSLPPSRAALEQHVKRATYQGGHCWGNTLKVNMDLPSPGNWGWFDESNWKPCWTTLPEASKSSRELIRCGCKKGCRGRCNCKKASLKCTALCQCDGINCDV